MSITRFIVGGALLAIASAVHAHAHLNGSAPAENSSGKSPERVELSFSEPARLTALTLQRDGEEARKLTPPTATAARLTIPVPGLVPGRYTLSWRVVGEDGHVTTGALHFTVVPSAETGSASSGPSHRS